MWEAEALQGLTSPYCPTTFVKRSAQKRQHDKRSLLLKTSPDSNSMFLGSPRGASGSSQICNSPQERKDPPKKETHAVQGIVVLGGGGGGS